MAHERDATARRAREVLAQNRATALGYAQRAGQERVLAQLRRAATNLERRLAAFPELRVGLADPFTAVQLRTTLAQLRSVIRDLAQALGQVVVQGAVQAAGAAATDTVAYLRAADAAFRGVGVQPLALREAAMLDAATVGVRSSVLRRLASSGTPAATPEQVARPREVKLGILDRYGVETVGHFEQTLRTGLLERKPWGELRRDIIAESPFLQGAPAHWATRIVRTEVMGAYGKASWEVTREAHKETGDFCKILSATFDDRTGSDSYAIHGMIRRPDEAFEWWEGAFLHPPNRPNDREIVVPHRVAWEIPKYLAWRDAAAIAAAWRREGRKGRPPPRPQMTTIPLADFGKG